MVMGYHRPTTEYNKGKYAEFADRKTFKEPALPDDAAYGNETGYSNG